MTILRFQAEIPLKLMSKPVQKPPLRRNFYVGARDSLLKRLYIFLRLNPWPRLDFEPDLRKVLKLRA
jgi:hypothetical protein